MDWSGCDKSDANLRDARLMDANLRSANLSRANLSCYRMHFDWRLTLELRHTPPAKWESCAVYALYPTAPLALMGGRPPV